MFDIIISVLITFNLLLCLLYKRYPWNVFSRKLTIEYNIKTLEHVHILPWINELIILNKGLKSLKGCPEGIKRLDLRNNKLTNLEYLPMSATHVRVSSNKINTLKHIKHHVNITSMGLSFNHLTTLEGFPPNCKSAMIYYNFITNPIGLPSHMDRLFLGNNLITSDKLKYIPVTKDLDLICNLLTTMEGLKEGVEILHVDNNEIKTLFFAPSTLTILRISNNRISNCDFSSHLTSLKVINLLKMNLVKSDTRALPKTVEEIFI